MRRFSLVLKSKKVSVSLICSVLFCYGTAFATSEWQGEALGFTPPAAGVLGTMGGIRPVLENNGFHFNLAWLSQAAWNASGGYNHDSHVAWIDQFSLTFQQDLEALTGIADAKIEGNIVNRNHDDSLTSKRLQDPRAPVVDISQESSGGGSLTRLGWLTFSRTFQDRKLHWRIGLMNKVQDFDQIIPCDFQLLSQCGGKSANSFTWYNWNMHYWGTVLQYKLTDELTIKGGIMEQNPNATSRGHAWSWSNKGSKGLLLPLELELKTQVNQLPGICNLGLLFTNAPQTDFYAGKTSETGADDPQGYRSHNRTWFWYGGFNQQLTRHNEDAARGLSASFSTGIGDRRSNLLHFVAAASLRYHGLANARPDDWLGLGVTWIETSKEYRRNQRYLNQLAEASESGSAFYNPVAGHAVNAELYYRFRAAGWLDIQPALQYWHRPGTLKETQDAWVAGLKTVVTF